MTECSLSVVVQADLLWAQTAPSMSHMTSFTWIWLEYFVTDIVFAISLNSHWQIVLATGRGNPPAVRFLANDPVQYSSRPGQEPDQECLRGVITWTRHKPAVFWPAWNWPAVPYCGSYNIGRSLAPMRFLRCDQIMTSSGCRLCSVISCSHPAFTIAMWLIFVESLRNDAKFHGKSAGCQYHHNKYWSHHHSETGRWNSS